MYVFIYYIFYYLPLQKDNFLDKIIHMIKKQKLNQLYQSSTVGAQLIILNKENKDEQ